MNMRMTSIPYVVEQTVHGERGYDIYSRLMRDRIVFIGGGIDDDVANAVIAQLLVLEAEDPCKDVFLYINSPGGTCTSGLAIYDTMQFIKSDVSTICMGQACSMAATLLAAGAKGKRFALPNSRIMIHQPWGGAHGSVSDIEIQAKEIGKNKDVLHGILAFHTGVDIKKITKDTDRDYFMSADEAKEYGIVDFVYGKE